jgi:hypothetical protein
MGHWGCVWIIEPSTRWPWKIDTHYFECLTPDQKMSGIDPIWCAEVACDTPLESSWWELQPCFRPHPDRSSERGVIAEQSYGSPNLGSFGTPPWES